MDAIALSRIRALLQQHAERSPQRSDVVAAFADFVHAHPWCCRRELGLGHLTGSAWLVDQTGTRVLLTLHRKLDRWLQPGGHADGNPDLAGVALREAEEESGLPGLTVVPVVFDLDRHWIPEHGSEPGHWHYDMRFVVRAGAREDFVLSAESHALAWVAIEVIAHDAGYDESLRRMASAWLARPADA
jgi:8-oxo-dGTP pyrophosphatase MutT (NUDIX family)